MNSSINYNRLKNEESLYLKQHAKNPIHWWPWGPEAILASKEQNKPILLSIGYSSCHWCHVMAHESFENSEAANIINENFIAIKVDREEYPDIDNYYQQAAQLFGKTGGWPLTAFLLPDLRPFFVGTYFPLKSSEKMGPGLIDLTKELSRAFKEDNEQVLENATKVVESITTGPHINERVQFEGHFPSPIAIMQATKELRDEVNGGFGTAPKFPQFSFYEWAIEQMLEGMIPKEHGEFIVKSIEKMLLGGITDHARGGIHRYATDEKWLTPHFEKMLYDQAGFLKTLTKLSLLYPAPIVYDSIVNTLEYLEAEMLSEDGYFFAAQDADSEGIEGLYFTFSETEFEDLINKHDSEDELLSKNIKQIKEWFQITTKGNFDHELNVISLNDKFKDEMYQQKNWDIIRKVRKAILSERSNRLPPATDNKGIASWNFMMISALTDVIQYNQIEFIKRKASILLGNVLEKVYNTFLVQSENGMRLRHSTTMTHSIPYLEDFVTFSESQLRMYEISGNPVFKQNFKDTIDFLTREFLDNDKMLTRAKFTNDHELYPNIEYSLFDNSFKSMTSTYIMLAKRAYILFSEGEYLENIKNLEDRLTQLVLKFNPIGAGEALRALTYPIESYRVIKAPRSWVQDDKFQKFIPFFLTRFVLDYTDELTDWQICNHNACEVNGKGIEEFIAALTPAGEQNA
jgi:uncharacterized protein YyaL (SSP411 family)